MLYAVGLIGLVTLACWICCLVDVLTTDEHACRNLPKLGWLVLVLLFPLVGSGVWLVAGRPWPERGPRPAWRSERPTTGFPEYHRPDRSAAADRESAGEFLRRCRERAEEQRRKARREDGDSGG